MQAYYKEKKHITGKEVITLLLGPLLGLIYIISLPFIVIATVITLAVEKVFVSTFNLLGNLVYFGWRPNESYLSGKKAGKKKDDKTTDPSKPD